MRTVISCISKINLHFRIQLLKTSTYKNLSGPYAKDTPLYPQIFFLPVTLFSLSPPQKKFNSSSLSLPLLSSSPHYSLISLSLFLFEQEMAPASTRRRQGVAAATVTATAVGLIFQYMLLYILGAR